MEKLKFALVTLGFKGQGDSYAEKLYKLLGVDSVYKLMTVEEKQLREHPEFGEKLVDLFLEQQKKALKEAGQLKALVAMDLPSIGKFVGKKLLDSFGLEKILSGEATREELLKLNGIGDVAATEASEALIQSRDEIEKTLKLFAPVSEEKKPSSSRGKICFTGKMEHKRSELQFMASSFGWEPVDTMGAGVLLVCADPSSSSSKMQKAKKLGCEVISEAEFLEMVKTK